MILRWLRLRPRWDTGPSSTEVLARTVNTLTRLSARKMTRPVRNANAAKAAEARRAKAAAERHAAAAARNARLKAEVARMRGVGA